VTFGRTSAFSRTASDYAATMAPALAPVAAEVVRRAALHPGETVLDVGTGTGTGARLALGEGRRVIGLDGAAGMLEIARHDVPEAELIEADFTHIPLDDGSVDVLGSPRLPNGYG
jgi:malonyl-CoA O-methyltransferase